MRLFRLEAKYGWEELHEIMSLSGPDFFHIILTMRKLQPKCLALMASVGVLGLAGAG